MGSLNVRTAVADFLAYARKTVATSTASLYDLYLSRLADAFGDDPLASLTPAKVRGWDQRWHPLQAAKRLTRWAYLEAQVLDRDPLAGLKKPAIGRRLRTLSPLESARLCRRARPPFRQLVIALGESIARPRELRDATWNDVRTLGLQPFEEDDLVAGRAFFCLSRFKACDRRADPHALRVIPISPRLGRMLARWWRRGPALQARVFTNRDGRAWTVNAVRCGFRRLRVRAGIAADARGENVVAYSLRHTAATAAIVAGVPVAELAGAMGHSDVRMTHRYVHLSPRFLAQVAGRVQAARRRRRKDDGHGRRTL